MTVDEALDLDVMIIRKVMRLECKTKFFLNSHYFLMNLFHEVANLREISIIHTSNSLIWRYAQNPVAFIWIK